MSDSRDVKQKRIFVAMPFRAEHDRVFSVLRDAAGLLGAEVVRLDEQSFAGSIVSKIRSEIEGADVVTAIVSEENGNVYYEIGLAHCQKKPVVLLTSDISSLKFDLRDHRAIVYDPAKPAGIRDELVRTLRSVIDIPSEPEGYVASVFGESPHATSHGLHKLVRTIASEHCLQEPVRLTKKQVLRDKLGMAIEVQDFMNTTVRAIVDINGIVQSSAIV